METRIKVFKNLYKDSVSLMQISAELLKRPDIDGASVAMATETNLHQLQEAGFELNFDAGPNDLFVAIRGADAEVLDPILNEVEGQLTAAPVDQGDTGTYSQPNTSVEMALDAQPDANLALISVPGQFAAAEAMKSLRLGLNVMLFSDNVSLEQELELKQYAEANDLLVMGPDCGTAIINGTPLGFANVVRPGPIGVIAASGTGLQEVTCRIHQLGSGISQAMGTGGHDLAEQIGGISMLHGMHALAKDPATEIIVLISKPPAPAVAETILNLAREIEKPVIIHFLGAEPESLEGNGVFAAETLAQTAEMAVGALSGSLSRTTEGALDLEAQQRLKQVTGNLAPTRRFLRGAFAGGTFCYEAQLLCRAAGLKGYSNTPVAGYLSLDNIWSSRENTLVDLGDDDFTKGRAHPMIDPSLRNERILMEATDTETAVVLFDVVLGYGASEEPIAELVTTIHKAQSENPSAPAFIAHVCGTDSDPQSREATIETLESLGVLVASNNAEATRWATHIVLSRQS